MWKTTTARPTSDLSPKHQTSEISLKTSDLMLKHQKWQHWYQLSTLHLLLAHHHLCYVDVYRISIVFLFFLAVLLYCIYIAFFTVFTCDFSFFFGHC